MSFQAQFHIQICLSSNLTLAKRVKVYKDWFVTSECTHVFVSRDSHCNAFLHRHVEQKKSLSLYFRQLRIGTYFIQFYIREFMRGIRNENL